MKINESQGTVLQQASRPAPQKEGQENAFQKVMEQTLSESDSKVEAPRAGDWGPSPTGSRFKGVRPPSMAQQRR